MGEADNPGPGRLRTRPVEGRNVMPRRFRDSDNVSRRRRFGALSSEDSDDGESIPMARVSRRVALVPQSPGDTPRSIQDVIPSTSVSDTPPVSSRTGRRRLSLVNGDASSTVAASSGAVQRWSSVPRHSVPKDVVDALEFDLTRDDSDLSLLRQPSRSGGDPVDVSSDDAPLVPSTALESVAPTVPASSRAIRQVRASATQPVFRLRATSNARSGMEEEPTQETAAEFSIRAGVDEHETPRARPRRLGIQSNTNRFSVLGDDGANEEEASSHEESQDEENLRGSDVEVEEVVEATIHSDPIPMEPRVRAPAVAFASLDAVNLNEVFQLRARVMRSVPFVFRGAYRMAIRVSMQAIISGVEAQSDVQTERGWKLFFLLPRMLLYRPGRGGLVPRRQLEVRIRQFQEGEWLDLLNESARRAMRAHLLSVRGRRRNTSDEAMRAARAMSLVQVGELSAARQALEGAALAPGNLATLRTLTDPARRPPLARERLSPELARTEPSEPFQLNIDQFLLSLRKARRGAAPGPSGMTSDHLFPVLESEVDSGLFGQVGSLLAVGKVPPGILQAIRLGRMTALSKTDGGVRGIVVGDIVRRLVARTMAKQIARKVEATTAPF